MHTTCPACGSPACELSDLPDYWAVELLCLDCDYYCWSVDGFAVEEEELEVVP